MSDKMGIFGIVESVPWQPGIGGPTLFGWLTAVVYVGASAICAVCAWLAAPSQLRGGLRITRLREFLGAGFMAIAAMLNLRHRDVKGSA